MSATRIPEVPIYSSAGRPSIPVIGMGTAVEPSGWDATKSAVIEAIKQGYRHFDTASIYRSEQALGEAIAEALKLGLIASRDELFITSKLWCSYNHPDLVLPALQKSLKLKASVGAAVGFLASSCVISSTISALVSLVAFSPRSVP